MLQTDAVQQVQTPRIERRETPALRAFVGVLAASTAGSLADAELRRRAADAYRRHEQHPVTPAPRVDVRG